MRSPWEKDSDDDDNDEEEEEETFLRNMMMTRTRSRTRSRTRTRRGRGRRTKLRELNSVLLEFASDSFAYQERIYFVRRRGQVGITITESWTVLPNQYSKPLHITYMALGTPGQVLE